MLTPKPQEYNHHVMSTFGRTVGKKQIREISLTKLFILTSRDILFKTESTGTADSSSQMTQPSPLTCLQSRRLEHFTLKILVNDCYNKVQYCQCTQDKGFEL